MESFGKAKYEWFSRFLELPNGIPSHDTFNRVFSAIDPKAFIECFIAWTDTLRSQLSKEVIAMVESVRETGNEYSCERRYFLVSMDCDAELFAKACRGHWGVENPLHWTLDVTFREDNSRARTGNAAENLAALRRLALNMLKKESSQKNSV